MPKKRITLIAVALAAFMLQLAAHAQGAPLCEPAFTVAAHASRDCVVIVPAKMQGAKIEDISARPAARTTPLRFGCWMTMAT